MGARSRLGKINGFNKPNIDFVLHADMLGYGYWQILTI